MLRQKKYGKFLWIFHLLIITIFLASCHRALPQKNVVTRLDKFDPMHIEVDPTGKLPPRFWDTYTLFEQAGTFFDAKQYDKAVEFYLKLVQAYPNSETAPLALFNAGLCYEELQEWDKAIICYSQIQKNYPNKADRIELQTRQGTCLENKGDWKTARKIFIETAEYWEATPIQRVEFRGRAAEALYFLGQIEDAEYELRNVEADYINFERGHVPYKKYFRARLLFHLGEVYYAKFEAVSLALPEEKLADQLEFKARLFILAREQYTKCILTYQKEWMTASLYKIGRGYEEFYHILHDAPLPNALSENEVMEYKTKLEKKIAPALSKALEAYQQNIRLGADLKIDNQWIQMSQGRLKVLAPSEVPNP